MTFKEKAAWLLKMPRPRIAVLPIGVWWMEGVVAHIAYKAVFQSNPEHAWLAWLVAGGIMLAVLRSVEFSLRHAFLVVAGSILATSLSHPEFRFVVPEYIQIPLSLVGFVIAVPLFWRGIERIRP